MTEPAAAVPASPTTDPLVSQRKGRAKTQPGNLRRNDAVGYLFISPWLVGFFLFALIPIAMSLWLAFTNYDLLSGKSEFIGLANFERMFFQDIRYGRSLSATFKYVALSVPLRLIFALVVAMLLNTKRRGVYWFRAAYYIPSIIGGSVAIAVMWRQLFGRQGVINAVAALGGYEPVNWLGNPDTAIWTLILLAVWQFGSPMLIFLAGLRQIPAEMYEAADIDGASLMQKIWRVTLPLLTPIIFFNLIMQLIAGFKQFTQAFVVATTPGAPLDTTLFYTLYLYIRAFSNFQMGYASAMAWILLLIVAVLTALAFKLSNRWVFYETKEG